jgi:hypothetical protein
MRRVLVIAMLALACDDPEGPIIIPPPEDPPLTTRTAVLHNLELAYNRRNITKLDELLDENFTFFLSEGDVHNGLPPHWTRETELQASTHLFSRNRDTEVPPRWPLCKSIDMDVQWEDGNLEWVEKIPDTAPDEVWYTATVFYDFLIEVEPDTRFLPISGAESQFIVRNVGTDDGPQWRLVEWHDLGSGILAAARASAATEETTWGKVKALYRE